MFNSQQDARAAGQQPVYDMARQMMWNRRGDKTDFAAGCLDLVQPELEDYINASKIMQDHCIPCTNVINIPSIDSSIKMNYVEVNSLSGLFATKYEAQQEKETNMYAQATVQMDNSLDYINRRLKEIRDAKANEAYKTFRMNDDGPRTIKELKAALKAGDYKIQLYRYAKHNDDEDEETLDFTDRGYNWTSMFLFKSNKDEKGYHAYRDELNAAYQKTRDHVTIVTDEKSRLKALEEFQAWKN